MCFSLTKLTAADVPLSKTLKCYLQLWNWPSGEAAVKKQNKKQLVLMATIQPL